MWQVVGRGKVDVGVLVEKPEGRRRLGRPRCGREDNIKNGYFWRASTGVV